MSRHKPQDKKLYQAEVKVGFAWIPAARHPVSADQVESFRETFRASRPGAALRFRPLDGVGRVR